MEMQGIAEKYFTLWAVEKMDQERLHPIFLEIIFELNTACAPLQNAACAIFAKEKSESPWSVERSDE